MLEQFPGMLMSLLESVEILDAVERGEQAVIEFIADKLDAYLRNLVPAYGVAAAACDTATAAIPGTDCRAMRVQIISELLDQLGLRYLIHELVALWNKIPPVVRGTIKQQLKPISDAIAFFDDPSLASAAELLKSGKDMALGALLPLVKAFQEGLIDLPTLKKLASGILSGSPELVAGFFRSVGLDGVGDLVEDTASLTAPLTGDPIGVVENLAEGNIVEAAKDVPVVGAVVGAIEDIF
jgi:hypothetical protein